MELSKEIMALRPYLFGIAYNMLAVVEEAEDIVQDVYVKWLSAKEIDVPKAYLGRMVVNASIDRLNGLKLQRESYKGYWMPEPYLTLEPTDMPTIEYGLLTLLERLNPVERAVFILRESFSESYANIAALTGLSEQNCRQLLHRAHEKLHRPVVKPADPSKRLALTEAFLYALNSRDLETLGRLLRDDIALFNDGGGKRAAALKPLFGLPKVLKFLNGIMSLPENQDHDFEYRPAYVNGAPCALIFRKSSGELDSMQYVEPEGEVIARLLYVRNPDKLIVRSGNLS